MSNSALFPFGYPTPTIVYVLLYVLTFSIHVVFMNYVLAGTLYMAFMSLFPGKQGSDAPISMGILRDWMPFFVSAAITAGIAPLLFLQILYQTPFYTANLLLFHRWMAILPALIGGFYLTYLLKSQFLQRRGRIVKCLVAVGAVACFCFTAFAWTENYSLSVVREGGWVDFYQRGRMFYFDTKVLSRLMIWVVGAFPTMLLILSWQLWHGHRHGREVPRAEMRRAASGAIAGWICMALLIGTYYQSMDEVTQMMITRRHECWLYLVGGIAGLAIGIASWIVQWRQWRFNAWCLSGATVGSTLGIVCVNMLREILRSHQIIIANHFDEHAGYSKVGGLSLFLGCFVANAILIAVCFLLVRRGKRPAAGETIDPTMGK